MSMYLSIEVIFQFSSEKQFYMTILITLIQIKYIFHFIKLIQFITSTITMTTTRSPKLQITQKQNKYNSLSDET